MAAVHALHSKRLYRRQLIDACRYIVLALTFISSLASLCLMYNLQHEPHRVENIGAAVGPRPYGRQAKYDRQLMHMGPSQPMVSNAAGRELVITEASPRQLQQLAQERIQHQLRNRLEVIKSMKRPPDHAYNFNVSVSDAIRLDRSIVDTRPLACREVSYNMSSLPKTSIVVPFYNEAWSTLLRTVHGILNRTPDELLIEIILVDDCSTYDYLKQPLSDYVSLLSKVKLTRNVRREGLIRSRLKGCEIARGEIIVFLDAHTECNVGWLPPLLVELKRRPTAVLQPFVDGIDHNTMTYAKPNDVHKGGFTWDLRYVWVKVPDHVERAALTEGRPFWSTTLVGCAIAMNRTYFLHIGGFDTDQKIWGGENLELAFRTWLCGGVVATVPCSRVGHLFRPLPYSNTTGWQQQWQKNLMRVADMWLGDYRRYFYSSTLIYPARRTNYTADEKASLAGRLAIKKRLQCRNFDWLLSNIAPEVPIPPHDALYHGELSNYRTNACWMVLPDGYLAISFACYEHKLIVDNVFSLNGDGLLMYKDNCVRFMFPQPNLKVERCPEKPTLEYGIWSVSYVDTRWTQIQVTHRHNGKITVFCVMHVTSAVEPHRRMQMPQTSPCTNDNQFQLWAFTYRFDYTYHV